MLVLTRRIGEQIVMPGIGVSITVLESRAGAIRLGISAPAEIVVLRQELYSRIVRGQESDRKAKVWEQSTSPNDP